MKIEVKHIRVGDDFSLFEKVAEKIYTPAQLLLKNEAINFGFFHSAIVILQNEIPAARCVIYNNPELRHNGKSTIAFGNYECIDDPEIARALFEEIQKATVSANAESLIGPMNGSTWDTYRLGKFDSDETFFLEPYNPVYYHEQFLNAGFETIAKYISNRDDSNHLRNDRTENAKKYLLERGIIFRSIDLRNYKAELEKMYWFCMDAFQNNFLFTPIDGNDFISKYLKAEKYIDPQYVIIAEDENSAICGFIFCLPNYIDKNQKGLIIKTLAKKPSIRYGGMGNILTSMVKERAKISGYDYLIHAFMHESNASKNLSAHFSGNTIREYHLYGKSGH
jgi:hypothetical protein